MMKYIHGIRHLNRYKKMLFITLYSKTVRASLCSTNSRGLWSAHLVSDQPENLQKQNFIAYMYMHINDFESVVLILESKIKKLIDYKLIENHNTQVSLTFTEI